jgi:hypothetical protein
VATDDADPASAIAKFEPMFNVVIDLLAFEMATAIGVVGAQVVDITPPVKVGEQRRSTVFAGGSSFDGHARSIEMQAITGRAPGVLPECVAHPIVLPSGLSIHPSMGIGGETTLTESDVSDLMPSAPG